MLATGQIMDSQGGPCLAEEFAGMPLSQAWTGPQPHLVSAAMALAVNGSSELYAFTLDRLTKAVGALLDRAVAAGEIRSDIGPEDLLRALAGMCYMHDQPGWQATVLRFLESRERPPASPFADRVHIQLLGATGVGYTSDVIARHSEDVPPRLFWTRGMLLRQGVMTGCNSRATGWRS